MASDRQASAAGLSALMCLLVALVACSPVGTRDPIVVTIRAVESADARAPLQFSVRAEPAPATDLTVSVTIAADGCDLTQSLESVTIVAAEDQAVFTVLTTSLEAGAGGECTVAAAIAPGEGYQVGAAASASAPVTPVTPGHQPRVVTIAAGDSPVTEGETAWWTLSATPAPTTELTVNLNWTQSGSFLPGTRQQTVTIPVSGAATVSVDTVDDSTDEPNGSVTLSVADGSGYAVGTPSTAAVTVTDDNDNDNDDDNDGPALPVVTIRASGATSIVEGATASWTLSATPAPTTELTVNLNWTQSGSFLPETRPQTVTIPVSGSGDGVGRHRGRQHRRAEWHGDALGRGRQWLLGWHVEHRHRHGLRQRRRFESCNVTCHADAGHRRREHHISDQGHSCLRQQRDHHGEHKRFGPGFRFHYRPCALCGTDIS